MDIRVEQRRGARGPHPNRVSEEVEAAVLDYCLKHPTYGAVRVANDLRLEGVNVSPSGVRGVWLRADLETRYKRLMRVQWRMQIREILVICFGRQPARDEPSH